MAQDKIICIFGGSGFLGKYITQELARAGYRVKIATRIPESAYELKTYGSIGQIASFQCNYNDPDSIKKAVKGCDAVINLVGILFQKGKNNFERAHIDIPTRIATAAQEEGVKRFVHISALACERGKSKYARSKIQGEKAIKKIFPDVTILRPSVVFGSGDNFLNMFARLSTILPALPLIGGGQTKFQPVFVGDVADTVLNVIQEKSDRYQGEIYELGGPEILTFKEIYEVMLKEINRDRALVSIPWSIAKIQGFVFGFMPKPLLTMDQVVSLKTDNIMNDGAKGLADVGVEPTALGTIIPQYLSCYRRGGRFSNKKSA